MYSCKKQIIDTSRLNVQLEKSLDIEQMPSFYQDMKKWWPEGDNYLALTHRIYL